MLEIKKKEAAAFSLSIKKPALQDFIIRSAALAVLVPGAGAARPGQLVDRDTHARVAHGHYRRKQQAERLSALAAGAQGPGPPQPWPRF